MLIKVERVNASNTINLGVLRTFDNGMVRYTYLDEQGKPMQADFDTRYAFDIWIGAMLAAVFTTPLA